MSTAEKIDYVTVEGYLAAEELSDVRHEYLGGLVYAMAGGSQEHNTISLNLALALRQHLRGSPCKVFMADVRVNFAMKTDDYYYYPDVVVTCDKRDTQSQFIHFPKLIIEILSPSTERVDKREKFFAYTTMESLEEYVLVAQDTREVIVASRANEWRKETVSGLDAAVTLASLGCSLPLSAIYEGV